jgi:predicted Na+-dependent transporter
MKQIIIILFFLIIIGMGYGFYIQSSDSETGDVIIGLSILAGAFILMPLFIYHRWKNKKVKDYMLTKENIEKMRDFQKEKKI